MKNLHLISRGLHQSASLHAHDGNNRAKVIYIPDSKTVVPGMGFMQQAV